MALLGIYMPENFRIYGWVKAGVHVEERYDFLTPSPPDIMLEDLNWLAGRLKEGRVVEEGTHTGLLSDHSGAYWNLVNAQQLSMDEVTDLDGIQASNLEISQQGLSTVEDSSSKVDQIYKPRSFAQSFGLLLAEQTALRKWYLALFLGCAGGGGIIHTLSSPQRMIAKQYNEAAFPIQAYLFAKIIVIFSYTGQQLLDAVDRASLNFFILGIGTGIAYFIMGFSANTIGANISPTYRQEYFESVLAKPISFYDHEDKLVSLNSCCLSSRIR
jgi:ATP-binding cassette subfamily B (MDR/TAP) protein 1